MRPPPGWTNCSAHVELLTGHAGVHRAGAGGFARELQPPVRAGAKPTFPGPALRSSVCVHQPVAQPGEDFVLGWDGLMGVRQAAGARPLLLAPGRGRKRDLARGAAERALERLGSVGKGWLVSALIRAKSFSENSSFCFEHCGRECV